MKRTHAFGWQMIRHKRDGLLLMLLAITCLLSTSFVRLTAVAEQALEDVTAAPAVESIELLGAAEEVSFADAALAEPEELVEEYIEQQFASALPGDAGGEDDSAPKTTTTLTGKKLEFLNFLKKKVAAIAAGNERSTVIVVPGSIAFEKYQYTKSDVMAIDPTVTKLSNRAIDLVFDDLEKHNIVDPVMHALLADCPKDLYWFDKRTGVTQKPELAYELEEAGNSSGNYTLYVKKLTIVFAVSESYSDGTIDSDTSLRCQVDDTGDTITKAVTKAEDIAAAHPERLAYERLEGFKDEICKLASYNHTAANNSANVPYGNPWQLVWVFDDVTDTKVVCEGYAKAFQYLCDLADIDGVTCRSVSGTMAGGTGAGGGHMWNVVEMDDGENYLVDVTNCDADSVGAPDKLFMKPPTSGSARDGYAFALSDSTMKYSYDDETAGERAINMFEIFTEANLTLSTTPYAGPICTVSFGAQGGSGSMDDVRVAKGASYQLPTCGFENSDGYVFRGWNTAASGDGTWYQPNDTIVVMQDTKLYAQWGQPILTLCSYDATRDLSAAGGTFAIEMMGSAHTGYGCDNYTVLVGDEYTVRATPDNGNRFVGWYAGTYISTDANGNPTQDARPNMDQLLSESASYSIAIDDDMVVCPVFEKRPSKQLVVWRRLAGTTALDTMQAIAREFGKTGYAVVTTNASFKDALAASALAGRYGALVLTTPKGGAAGQTKAALKAAGVKTVFVIGGTGDITKATANALKSGTGVTKVERVGSGSASQKAVAMAKKCGKRSDTVIIATQASFKDALSIAPYSYATKSPILYTEGNKKLSNATLKYVKGQKFSKAIVVGSTAAIPASVDTQLKKNGVKSITRLAGANGCQTSLFIAQWATGARKNGRHDGGRAYVTFQPSVKLSPNNLAVATSLNWKDAACGAALCGKRRSVLLLADNSNSSNVSFVKTNATKMKNGYVFGGPPAVSEKVWNALSESTTVYL